MQKADEQGEALKEIVGLKLYFGEYVDAFDNAARIPDSPTDKDLPTDEYGRLKSAKVQSLSEVAQFFNPS